MPRLLHRRAAEFVEHILVEFRGQLAGVSCLLSHVCPILGLSGWHQVSLPTEPSCQLSLNTFSKLLSTPHYDKQSN